MQPAILHALEFDRVRETLAFQTLTPAGGARNEGGNGATIVELKD